MKDPYLLEMTASEPLSMEEEVKMQQTWKDDEMKCTFIILSRENCGNVLDDGSIRLENTRDGEDVMEEFVTNNLDAMVGDVNLFLSQEEEDEKKDTVQSEMDFMEAIEKYRREGVADVELDLFPSENEEQEETSDQTSKSKTSQAEIDIMVADEKYRRKGIGKEAVCLMMEYAATDLGIRCITAKIKDANDASKQLFEKCLGFTEQKYVDCFKEYDYRLKRDSPELLLEAIHELYPHESHRQILGT